MPHILGESPCPTGPTWAHGLSHGIPSPCIKTSISSLLSASVSGYWRVTMGLEDRVFGDRDGSSGKKKRKMTKVWKFKNHFFPLRANHFHFLSQFSFGFRNHFMMFVGDTTFPAQNHHRPGVQSFTREQVPFDGLSILGFPAGFLPCHVAEHVEVCGSTFGDASRYGGFQLVMEVPQ